MPTALQGLGGELTNPFQRGRGGPGGWWILDEPDLHLGPHILVPDLAGWRRERLPVFPETPYFELAPDWVCEVLSPGTARTDRVVKMPIYAAQGVTWLWLIDPDQQTLEVYRLLEGHWLLEQTAQQEDEVTAPPFGEHWFLLEDLWAPMGDVGGGADDRYANFNTAGRCLLAGFRGVAILVIRRSAETDLAQRLITRRSCADFMGHFSS
jgi:hypothetical protein